MPTGNTLFGDESESQTVCCPHCDAELDSADEVRQVFVDNYVYSSRQARTRDGCEECSDECDDCNRVFEELPYRNASRRHVCESCGEHYTSCDDCGEIIHSDDSHWHEGRQASYCSTCLPGDESQAIKSYDYKPYPMKFLRADGEKSQSDALYLGMEIEAECTRDSREDIAEDLLDDETVYLKDDGSIHDGFEAVSHPATWKYWQSHKFAWAKEMRRRGMRSYNTTTCGMHVHASRKFFTKGDEFKLRKFFRDNARFILSISRRQAANLDRWAAIDTDTTRRLIEKTMHGDAVRYAAVNFSNGKTIEFRIFRGTLDIEAIRRNVAFVVAVSHYVKHASIATLSARDMVEWTRDNGSKILGKKQTESLATWMNQAITHNPRTGEMPVESEESVCA